MIYLVMDSNGYMPASKFGGNIRTISKNGIGKKKFSNGRKYIIKK